MLTLSVMLTRCALEKKSSEGLGLEQGLPASLQITTSYLFRW